jgi:hypothetical protein
MQALKNRAWICSFPSLTDRAPSARALAPSRSLSRSFTSAWVGWWCGCDGSRSVIWPKAGHDRDSMTPTIAIERIFYSTWLRPLTA